MADPTNPDILTPEGFDELRLQISRAYMAFSGNLRLTKHDTALRSALDSVTKERDEAVRVMDESTRQNAAQVDALNARCNAISAEHRAAINNLCGALFPDSPLAEARAEFFLDAVGACEVIRRNRDELTHYRSRQKDIAEWADQTFGQTTVEATIRRIDCELREFFDDPTGEAKDLVIFLYRLMAISGRNLDAEVDSKMAINRKRQWVLAGDGTGQHTGSEQQIGLMAELTRLKERNREIATRVRTIRAGFSPNPSSRSSYIIDMLDTIADALEAGK